MKPYITTIPLLILALLLTGCQTPSSTQRGKIQITATFYPVADIARQVGGDKVEVATLLPSGADLHHFMPTMTQIKQLNKAHLVFRAGYGADPYLDNMMKSVDNPRTKLVEVSKGAVLLPMQADNDEQSDHEAHQGMAYDPHLWLSLANLKVMVNNTCEALITQSPSDKAYFTQRQSRLLKRLSAMQAQANALRNKWKQPNYIAVHSAFRYLNNEFGLKQVGVFEPRPGVETSTRDLRNLIDTAKKSNARCIFVAAEEQHKLADSIAGDIGLPIYTLDACTQPETSDDPGILVRMQGNIDVLRKAMQ